AVFSLLSLHDALPICTFLLSCSIFAALSPAGPAPMMIVSNMAVSSCHQVWEFCLLFDTHAFFHWCQACSLVLFSADGDATLGTVADVAVEASRFAVLFMGSECSYAVGEQGGCQAFPLHTVNGFSVPFERDKFVPDGP